MVEEPDYNAYPAMEERSSTCPTPFLDNSLPTGTHYDLINSSLLFITLENWSYSQEYISLRLYRMGIRYLGSLNPNPHSFTHSLVWVRVQNSKYYSEYPVVLGMALNSLTVRRFAHEFDLTPHFSYSATGTTTSPPSQLAITITNKLLSIVLIVDLAGWTVDLDSPELNAVDYNLYTDQTQIYDPLVPVLSIILGRSALDQRGILGIAIGRLSHRVSQLVDFTRNPHRTFTLVLRPSRDDPMCLVLHSQTGEYSSLPLYVGGFRTCMVWQHDSEDPRRFPASETPSSDTWYPASPLPPPPALALLPTNDLLHNTVTRRTYVLPEEVLTLHAEPTLLISMAVGEPSGLPYEPYASLLGTAIDPWFSAGNYSQYCSVRLQRGTAITDRLALLTEVITVWSLHTLLDIATNDLLITKDYLPCTLSIRSPTLVVIIYVVQAVIDDRPAFGVNDPVLTRIDKFTNEFNIALAGSTGFFTLATRDLCSTYTQQIKGVPQGRNFIAFVITPRDLLRCRITAGWNASMSLPNTQPTLFTSAFPLYHL